MGSRPSKAGDVYSFGILMLEMLTGKRPTDELFQDGLNLHSYAKAALADRGVEIADPKLVQERDEQIQMCLVCMIKVGVACSVEFPADRMKIRDVVEYGMGSRPSKAGDVYSFGILILEMLSGKRPTDELFQDGLNLHSYAKAALADRGVEIADPKLVQERDEEIQMRKKGKSSEENDKFDVCLVSMFKVGVACCVEFPGDRMKIGDVVGELNKSKKSFLM
nr:probable LRR receptor-like serine/threonine-protein kinase At3g47570 [Ipomoea trifida]